jgi:hypothetical protein
VHVKRLLLSTFFAVAVASPTVAWGAGPAPASAGAPDKAACADAYAQAQSLRDAHKLIDARAQLRVCAQPTCPAFIVKDCTTWLADEESRVPSVTLLAKDGAGNAVIDVTVTVDGAPFATKADGEALDIDPGPHTFSFVARDGTKVDKQVVVAEGQKAQQIAVTLGSPAPVAAPAGPVAPAPPAPAGYWTTQRVLGVTSAGVGVVGVILGSVFGGLAIGEASQQNTDCGNGGNGPTCAHETDAKSAHNAATTDGLISDIGFIAGGVLVAGGAVLFFTGGPKAGATTGLYMVPSVGHEGGGLTFGGAFE